MEPTEADKLTNARILGMEFHQRLRQQVLIPHAHYPSLQVTGFRKV